MARRLLLAMIRMYRAGISPLLPGTCRYVPTCSEYALVAVRRFGVLRGSWMALRRILRCHPFGGFGPDPVPGAPEGGRSAGTGRERNDRFAGPRADAPDAAKKNEPERDDGCTW